MDTEGMESNNAAPDAKRDTHVVGIPGDGSSLGATPGGANILEIHDTNPLDVELPYDMMPRADKATKDEQLQKFVNSATLSKDQSRKKVCLEVFGSNYDRMRDHAGEIKQHTLDNIDYYINQFIENATAAGTKVHFAFDAKQLNDQIIAIAKAANSTLCVKAKSMVTEESHLAPELTAAGVTTIETDLGEFILQLDHDAPSHIVQPMIHKDRKATARAFTRELGAKYTEDPQELTQIARDLLRDKYRKSDLGMSGGNFLVAETGTVVICTNEGNGRLSTSVPRTYIAVVGFEKLIPRLDDLGIFLKLLSRSATGQPLTVYTHIMTGPKREAEHGGPSQMHVILVDNGRSNMLPEETREMLRCIRCGACLNACPVYRKVGGHAYGSVYSGPIGAIITPMLKGLENYPDLPHASSLCGACYEACPVKINIPKYLIQLRRDMIKQGIGKKSDAWFMGLWAKSLNNGTTYRLGGWAQKFAFRWKAYIDGTLPEGGDPYSSRGWINYLPGPVEGWTRQRDMPTPPERSFRQWWNNHRIADSAKQRSKPSH
jgi:L-lactate dehydrogenase complex protein LldF